jgi:hypothetical protein
VLCFKEHILSPSLSCDFRSELQKIKKFEKRLLENPKPSNTDKREEVLSTLSSDEDDGDDVPSTSTKCNAEPKPKTAHTRKKASKRPLTELVRANQEAYNDFITKKVPKLLRALGVSSDSE